MLQISSCTLRAIKFLNKIAPHFAFSNFYIIFNCFFFGVYGKAPSTYAQSKKFPHYPKKNCCSQLLYICLRLCFFFWIMKILSYIHWIKSSFLGKNYFVLNSSVSSPVTILEKRSWSPTKTTMFFLKISGLRNFCFLILWIQCDSILL